MKSQGQAVLIVEDVDTKFRDIMAVVEAYVPDPRVTRAENLNKAEDLLMNEEWALMLLDLSMDIAASGSMDLGSGHATLAGLDVVERIALLKLHVPVIMVTGFDTFQDPDRFDNSIMSMVEVDVVIKTMIGDLYHGCVRYGRESWRADLEKSLAKWRLG